MQVSKSIKIPFSATTIGAVLLIGYLGYRLVRWMLQPPSGSTAARTNTVKHTKLASEQQPSSLPGPSSKPLEPSRISEPPKVSPRTVPLPDPQLVITVGKTAWRHTKVFAPSALPLKPSPAIDEEKPSSFKSFVLTIRVEGCDQEEVEIDSERELNRRIREIKEYVEFHHVNINIIRSRAALSSYFKGNMVDNKVHPKIAKTEDPDEGTIRRYENGVIEEEEEDMIFNAWKGRRTYPDGTVHTGLFREGQLDEGTVLSADKKMTLYRPSYDEIIERANDRTLITRTIGEHKQLVVASKRLGDDQYGYYIHVDESPFPLLTQLLKDGLEEEWDRWRLSNIFGLIDVIEFRKYLFDTQEILHIENEEVFKILFEHISNEPGLFVQWYEEYGKSSEMKQMFLVRLAVMERDPLDQILALNPKLFSPENQTEREAFVRALVLKNKPLFEAMRYNGITLLPEEEIFRRIEAQNQAISWRWVCKEGSVTQEELRTLSSKDQAIAYQFANMNQNFPILSAMRGLGFGVGKNTFRTRAGSIFSCDMDTLTMHERLRDFLTGLRSQQRVFTLKEYQERYPNQDRAAVPSTADRGDRGTESGSIASLVASDYMRETAEELGLKHIKVARKILVIDQREPSQSLVLYINNQLQLSADSNLRAYTDTQHIKSKPPTDPLTRDQASELLSLCVKAEREHSQIKFIIAEDGIMYITHMLEGGHYIKKEGSHYREMIEFVTHSKRICEQDREPLCTKLEQDRKRYLEQEEQLDSEYRKRMKVEETALKRQFHQGNNTLQVFKFNIQDIFLKEGEAKKEG